MRRHGGAAWLGERDLRLLRAGPAVVAGTWFCVFLAGIVQAGSTQAFDRWMTRARRVPSDPVRPIGPHWPAEEGRDFSARGGYAVRTLLTANATIDLAIRRQPRAAGPLLIATIGGPIVMQTLKALVGRPRPAVVPHRFSHVVSTRFPSGHAMLSAVVYLTLGTVLARLIDPRRLKTYVLSLALPLTFLVGVGRVFPGVHHPSDVLGGRTAGLVWAIGRWLLTRSL